MLFFTNCLFHFCANYDSFVFRRIFKVTISLKGISFGRTYGHQENFSEKEEEMRQLLERLQILEEAQGRPTRKRRCEQRKSSRSYTHYGSQEEDQDWRVHNFEDWRHQNPPSKHSFPFIKFPSFSGESDPNVFLGWEAKYNKIFNVYEVQEDQKVKLASLEFLDYAMQWWHQIVMYIGLNKRPTVVSWYDLK